MALNLGKNAGGAPANPLGTTDTGVPAGTVPAGGKQQIGFTVASMLSSMVGATLLATAGQSPINSPYQLPTRGYVRGMWLSVTITVAANAATVVAPTGAANFPFSYISGLSLIKPNGDILLPPNTTGWDLYLDNKYFARGFQPFDPKQDPVFVTPTVGAGATAGSGKFILYIAFELDSVDAFAAQSNADGASAYSLNVTTNTAAIAYGASQNGTAGTPPTAGTTSLSFETQLDYWPVPAGSNVQVAPTSLGSRSFLDLQTPVVNASTSQVKLTAVGSNIRAIAFQLLNAAGARTDVDWPNLTRIELEGIGFFARYIDIWKSEMARSYRYIGALDGPGGIDSGVYIYNWPIMRQGFVSADSPRSQWLRTAPGSDLELYPSVFGAGATTLRVLTSRVTMPSAAAVAGN
jgi:hypothetical protein